jgi:hypothetical protein
VSLNTAYDINNDKPSQKYSTKKHPNLNKTTNFCKNLTHDIFLKEKK